jgi:hypothetical protein
LIRRFSQRAVWPLRVAIEPRRNAVFKRSGHLIGLHRSQAPKKELAIAAAPNSGLMISTRDGSRNDLDLDVVGRVETR